MHHLWTSIDKSINDTWARLTTQVRQRAREAYSRDLCLVHRLRFVHTYLFAKIWYAAQILPAPCTYTQRITSAATFLIWKGATFTVLVSTFQLHKTRGGWELVMWPLSAERCSSPGYTCKAHVKEQPQHHGYRHGDSLEP